MKKIHIVFSIEFLILMICPLPFYEVWISQTFLVKPDDQVYELGESLHLGRFLSDYLLVFMSLRFMFLMRTIFDYSIYNDEYSKKICRHHSVPSGIRFTIKCFLNKKPNQAIFYIFVATILIDSYILRMFELPYQLYITKK